MAQDASRMSPGWPQDGPGRPRPGIAQDGAGLPLDRPRMAQDSPWIKSADPLGVRGEILWEARWGIS